MNREMNVRTERWFHYCSTLMNPMRLQANALYVSENQICFDNICLIVVLPKRMPGKWGNGSTKLNISEGLLKPLSFPSERASRLESAPKEIFLWTNREICDVLMPSSISFDFSRIDYSFTIVWYISVTRTISRKTLMVLDCLIFQYETSNLFSLMHWRN